MADAYRRVVPKAPNTTPDQLDALRRGLQDSVRLQRELAHRSLHVLELFGDLQEDETCFFLEHEPAKPEDSSALFDPNARPDDGPRLLAAAVGLADALRVAHAETHPKQAAHGGICPGVVLTDPAGTIKLTDFGFARVICETLGVKSYIELAVGPADIPSSTHRTTGCWQVLREDDHTRDDRLCAFVDPYKYGNAALATFERASDIIALGLFLHLLAEHRHPLLDRGDDHRLVATSESMAYFPYAGARRQDLRKSTDAAVLRWCELVTQMLSSEPQDRPSVKRILDAFDEVGVRPLDLSELFARRRNEARELDKMGRWEEVRDKVAPLLADPNVPPPIAEQAKQLAERASLHLLIREADRIASTDDWRNARKLIDQLPKTGLPPDVTQARENALERLRGLRRLEDELNAVETVAADLTVSDADTSLSVVTGLLGRLEQVADESTVPSQRRRRDQLLQTLIRRRSDLTSDKETLAAEHEAVRAWLATVKQAWEAEDWAAFEACRQGRPTTPRWPNDVKKSFEKLEEHYRIVQTAVAWIAHVPQTLPENDVTLPEQLLAERPELHGNPPGLSRGVEQVATRLRDYVARATDFRRAREWITGVSQAVNAADWPEAKQRLLRRPTLAHCPAEVLEEADRLGVEIDLQLKQQELVRIVVGSWLESAQSTADHGDLERAIAILSEPPPNAKPLAKATLREVDKRVEDYKRGLRDRIARRDEIAKAEVETVVRDLLGRQFRDLIDPGLVEVRLDAMAWDAETLESNAKARVHVTLPSRVIPAGKIPRTHAVELRSAAARVTVVNAEPLGTDLASTFIESIKQAQQTRLADVVRPLQDGLFPQARADAPNDRPVPRTMAAIRLLGNDVPTETLEVELAWDPRALQWTILRPEDFHRRLQDFVMARAQPHAKPLLLKRSPLLARHESALTVEVTLPPGQRFDPASRPLRLEGRVDIALNEQAGHRASATFPVSCPSAGTVVVDADPGPIEAKLLAVIAAAQESARTALERTLGTDVQALPAKVKLAVHTKSIKRPVEAVMFSLRPKHGQIRELSAAWNDKTLQFDPPDNWPDILQELSTPAIPAPAAPPRRRATIGLAGAAVVALTAGIWAVWPSTPNGHHGDGNTNRNDNAHKTAPPKPPPDPPPLTPGPSWTEICNDRRDEAVSVLRKADLPDKANFDQHAESLVKCEPLDKGLRLCVRIPGLFEKPEGNGKATTLDAGVVEYQPCVPLDARFRSGLPDDLRNRISADLRDLQRLLDQAPSTLEKILGLLEKSVQEKLDTSLIDPTLVSLKWDPNGAPTWTLDETAAYWQTKEFTFQTQIKRGSGAYNEPIPNDHTIRLVVRDGRPKTEPETLGGGASGLAEATNGYVKQLRTAAQTELEESLSSLKQQGWDVTPSLNLPPTQPAWTLKRDRFVDRTWGASWNPQTLAFDRGEWDDKSVADLGQLASRLEAIDQSIATPDHWMRKPWNGADVLSLQEARGPKHGTWRLMLPAPWPANPGQQQDMLYITARLEGDNYTLITPDYWPILERYGALTREPQVLTDEDAKTLDFLQLPAGEQKAFQELVNLKQFAPRLGLASQKTGEAALRITWTYDADRPVGTSLTVPGELSFGGRENAEWSKVVDAGKLNAHLEEQAPAYPCRVTLTVNPKDVEPAQKIQIVENARGGADPAVLKEFDKVLGELPGRIQAESDLEKIHAKGTDPLNEPDFRSALQTIWTAKLKPVANVGNALHGIRTGADGPVRSRYADGKLVENLTNLHANVFVEYFTGPKATYALAWSTRAKGDTTEFLKRPVLLRSADAEQVPEFFRRVLREVFPENQDPEVAELGIAVGADEGLPRDLAALPFTELKVDVANDQASGRTQVRLTSLADLRKVRGQLANYVLVPTLSDLLVTNPRLRLNDFESTWKDSKSSAARRQAIEWRDKVGQR